MVASLSRRFTLDRLEDLGVLSLYRKSSKELILYMTGFCYVNLYLLVKCANELAVRKV